ncbi:MAG: GDP-mannose 4,6-dehydratase [Pseudomonadota bacterium]
MTRSVLLTGGAGYISTHTYLAFCEAGYRPVILDSFANAKGDVPERLEAITGKTVPVIRGDVRDEACLARAFAAHHFAAMVHFAAPKSVAHSVARRPGEVPI